jgi:O-acetylserine/cysteine efflux transporter
MQLKDFLIAVTVTCIWGVNFSVIKLGLASLDPFMLSGLRFLLCALPLVFFIKKPDVKFIYLISYGIFFGVGLWGMVSLGIYFGISAGMASLVLQMSVFFTIVLSYFILGDTIDISKKIAFVLALFAIGLIITITDGSVTYIGLAFVLFGALSWAITNIIIKKAQITQVFAFIVWSSLFSPIPLFLLAYLTQGEIVYIEFFQNLNQTAIFSILFQVYPTTLLGYWIWNSLLTKYPVSIVAPITLLVPLFGLLGSYFIFDETIGSIKIFACILIVVALIINTFGAKFRLYSNK